ncbi:MAG: metalloprotease [Planctomycetota bacterium]|jgi:Zn-dependent protease
MPTRGTLIGRLFRTDIYATSGFFLLVVLLFAFYWNSAWVIAVYLIALVISLLTHEFGHVFAVRWFLKSHSVVVLWGLGGLCIHEPTPVIRKRIGISLMGPAFGFVLGGVSWAVSHYLVPEDATAPLLAFMGAMVFINVVYTALNLLPIVPLDGGQAALAALESRLGPARARAWMRKVSVIVAGAGVAVAVYAGWYFAAFLAGMLVFQNLFAARHGL